VRDSLERDRDSATRGGLSRSSSSSGRRSGDSSSSALSAAGGGGGSGGGEVDHEPGIEGTQAAKKMKGRRRGEVFMGVHPSGPRLRSRANRYRECVSYREHGALATRSVSRQSRAGTTP
jgi:hypothetical protein